MSKIALVIILLCNLAVVTGVMVIVLVLRRWQRGISARERGLAARGFELQLRSEKSNSISGRTDSSEQTH